MSNYISQKVTKSDDEQLLMQLTVLLAHMLAYHPLQDLHKCSVGVGSVVWSNDS